MSTKTAGIVLAAAILAGIGYVVASSSSSPEADRVSRDQSSPLLVSEQELGSDVLIDEARLSAPGFIAIHEDRDGGPGRIIGATTILSSGAHENVQVPVNRDTEDGERLYAMLHEDDGDGLFLFPGPDAPMTDDSGKIIVREFSISGGAGVEERTRTVVVSGDEFSYSPSEIRVGKGERVRIEFRNAGSAPHNFVIEGLDVRTSVIRGGASETVEFVPPDPGSYPMTFFCSVPGHREAGMEGVIVVE